MEDGINIIEKRAKITKDEVINHHWSLNGNIRVKEINGKIIFSIYLMLGILKDQYHMSEIL